MEPVPLLDLKAQHATIRGEVERAIREVVESQGFILGPPVEAFEKEVASFVGAAHAVACASGTDALILSLAALGVGPGDEVVTTPFSFFATASCAYRIGARPVFVDIDGETLNIDPSRIDGALGPRSRVILPVHLYGACADMEPILDLARRRGLRVVEDAAQALGASYRSREGAPAAAGSIGDLGCFSFFPSKNLGGYGDGGMIVTSDGDLAASLRSLRVHGETERYHHRHVGWNSRLDALQAAVLRVKLPRLPGWCDVRCANAARYDALFAESGLVDRGDVRLPARSAQSPSIFNQYTIRVRDRSRLVRHLQEHGIGHAIYYPVPLHLQECFRDLGHREGDFPVAEQASREVLSLPIFPELAPAALERVVETVVRFYGREALA